MGEIRSELRARAVLKALERCQQNGFTGRIEIEYHKGTPKRVRWVETSDLDKLLREHRLTDST